MLTQKRYEELAKTLKENEEVKFTDGDLLVKVTTSEDGYMVDIWDINDYEFGEENDPDDGGHCSGEPINAVQFYNNSGDVNISISFDTLDKAQRFLAQNDERISLYEECDTNAANDVEMEQRDVGTDVMSAILNSN